MGVLTDYFRAPGADAVRQVLERTEGGSPLVGRRSVFDGVPSKGLDPGVVLGQLIAAIREVPWGVDLVGDTPVWPPGPVPGPDGPEGEEDPWVTGPWVFELDAATRDTLAGVPDAAVPEVTARWVQAEELYGAAAEDMQPVTEWLIRLARNARAAGELLYCWMCL
ncbi:hypothetical protein [Kitasatospora sp. NPDC059571]|uniref:hypothetical protein n=1 Tax=Kitasatospora sp. NPDC059571 TaxID=3346871 RepID=UPI0036A9F271